MSSKEVKIDVVVSLDDEAIKQTIQDAVDESVVSAGGSEIQEQAKGEGMQIGAMEVASMMRNPTGFASARLMAMGALPVAVALMVKPIIEAVAGELTRPGGFFDKRVKIIIEDQQEFWLNREQQQATRVGNRQVIVQASHGFSNQNSDTHDSIYRRIAEDRGDGYRTSGIGLNDKANGLKEELG